MPPYTSVNYDVVKHYDDDLRDKDKSAKTRNMPPLPTFNDLHQTLIARYDLEEFRTLCAQLGVPYDDLRGEGRSAKARELILWLQRYDRLEELAAAIRPDARPASARGQAASPARPAYPDGPIRERWALLVGVDHYQDPSVPTLKYCVNDVLALECALKELGYTVVAMHDAADSQWQPRRNNVEAKLALLCQAVQPDDLLLVHFACHGHMVGGDPVLVIQDTRNTAKVAMSYRVAAKLSIVALASQVAPEIVLQNVYEA